MFSEGVLQSVQNAVCAIGFLPLPLTEWRKEPSAYPFQVIGTGFLVRPTTVMTNKHVIEKLREAAFENYIPEDQLFISFVTTQSPSSLLNVVRMVRRSNILDGIQVDLAFIEFKRDPPAQFADITPLASIPAWDVEVGTPVCVCGYPYGNKLLERDGQVERWGPVVQTGFVSAISPFSKVIFPKEILLDVRTGKGMSGSPVFLPKNGRVIGIHHEGAHDSSAVGAVAFALPLIQPLLDHLLDLWDKDAPPQAQDA